MHPLATLDTAGEIARGIEGLWWAMLVLGGVVMVAFCIVLAAALRDRGEATGEDDSAEHGASRRRWWLVGAGIVQPLALIAIVFALTVVGMRAIPEEARGEDALVIEVTGFQWWYEVHYPQHDVTTANELHLPVGQDVELRLFSADVVHSFWVPQLAGKTDMLPDGPTTTVISADRPGEFPGRCAEFCGLQHTRMGFTAVAEAPEDFQAWLDAQARPAAAPEGEQAVRGQEVFLASNCVQCHAIRGVTDGAPAEPGPDLTHLAGRPTLGATTVANDPEQLLAWIDDPHAVKEGVAMPPSPLDGDDLDDLVAYLGGLR